MSTINEDEPFVDEKPMKKNKSLAVLTQNDPIEEESKESDAQPEMKSDVQQELKSINKSSLKLIDSESAATKKTSKKSKRRDDSASLS